ncbi:DapH/DapD/GlmU-related protein [Rhodoplanes sp. TEM]|uniref:DapH/DapD/GlmU-related protein n=1 Tax=Rhodoplanes tepidamans TaxID=200616 RepID=A0ABT5JAU3_RHOTP|nr:MULTISPECIES: DapH/DapD/GlmU-related protein [Rhodoplanes]MDC7786716.1 DapH/DapD/GlmU-related protein [Rhodoplanes tepidamans]MDC7983722.1 DapH/DapD/GlmU-related protein [Rhodoplanes sp. TEM]MDQ0358152.1 putative colanic acid biosynthesis acetyltransferase WcaF [Rhodoplanes tepidamans]
MTPVPLRRSAAPLDAAAARPLDGGPSFGLRNRAFRAAWGLAWLLLARWTPPPLHGWRRLVLRAFGARIAPGARIYGSVRIWYPPHLSVGRNAVIGPGVTCYSQAPITVHDRAVVSQGAHLCTGSHDVADPHFQLVTEPIVIGARAWIAAEAFVGPGVTIGDGAVLGARGVAFRDLAPWTVYAGNPARPLRARVLRDADGQRCSE